MKTAICLVVKNEEATLLEWIAFHSIVGFDSFLILDDRSTDQTADFAKLAARHLDVRVMPWTEEGRGKQGAGYEKICRRFGGEFDWIAFIDSDEFIVPSRGETISDLLERNDGSAAIAIPWRMFGSSGHMTKPGGLVIENFQYCAATDFPPNRHVKSIVRPSRVISSSNSHHFMIDGSYVLPDGMAAHWREGPGVLSEYPVNSNWLINHYFTRSLQHWYERMRRGQLGSFVRTLDEFHVYDRNEVFEPAAAGLAARVEQVIEQITTPGHTVFVAEKEAALATVVDVKLLAEDLPSKSAEECTKFIETSNFASGRNVHTIVHGSSTVKLNTAKLSGPNKAPTFCGPFFLLPDIGKRPLDFPTCSLSPPLKITRLSNILYMPGQVAIAGTTVSDQRPTILAESFNNYWDRRNHHAIKQETENSWRLKRPPQTLVPTPGRYLFLDNQHRDHFGHIFADVLSLAWSFYEITRLGIQGVKVLVFQRDLPVLRDFLGAVGISPETLVCFNEAVMLEEVFFATKCYQTHGYSSPTALENFGDVIRFFGSNDQASQDRIYFSRRNVPGRKLVNEDKVVSLFAARGFAIIEPENLSVAEQVRLAANARMIAGPSGSNLFHLAFQKSLEKAFVITSPNFVRLSEHLLNAGHQAQLTFFVGEALGSAVHSSWSVDENTIAQAIDAWLDEPSEDLEETSKIRFNNNDLVFDIGMSEGNDSAFYLAKGFRVVGVEADVEVYYALCERFEEEIQTGRMKIYNSIASENDGEIIEFFHHKLHQGLSGTSRSRAEFQEGSFTNYYVTTIDWQALLAEHGVPYYLKLDIEGHEAAFLKGMNGHNLPSYTSVECHSFAPVERLYSLGYRRFMLVDQNPPSGFRLPELQLEGKHIEWREFHHSSGPFGRDLPDGLWVDFESFKVAWQDARPHLARTWFDCHAWMP